MEQFGMPLLCWYTQSNEDFTQRLNIKPKVPQREESLYDPNKWLITVTAVCVDCRTDGKETQHAIEYR